MKLTPFRLLILLLLMAPLSPLRASQEVLPAQAHDAWMQKTETLLRSNGQSAKLDKRLHRTEKRLSRLSKRYGAVGPDFNDPIEKWLWFGLIGLGLALVVFSLVSFGLAGLVGFAAIVCLVIWIVKREQAV